MLIIPLSFLLPVYAQKPLTNLNPNSGKEEIQSGNTSLAIEQLLLLFVRNGSKQLYDGTFVYLFDDQVQTFKVHRSLDEQGLVIEDFTPLDSSQKNTSRVLKNQFCQLENGWQYQFQDISSSFPFRINNHYQQLQKHYDFSLIDTKPVAANPTTGLFILPRDPYRYGYQLWFEPQTGTLLKYKLMSQKGKAIEQYFFTNLTWQNDLELLVNNATIEQPRSELCRSKFNGLYKAFAQYFLSNKIPPGYDVVSFRQGEINSQGLQAQQFQFSDGLASVSVFIEELGKTGKMIDGVLQLGPVNVAGRTIGKYQVTVLGAIPVNSALRFLSAVKP